MLASCDRCQKDGRCLGTLCSLTQSVYEDWWCNKTGSEFRVKKKEPNKWHHTLKKMCVDIKQRHHTEKSYNLDNKSWFWKHLILNLLQRTTKFTSLKLPKTIYSYEEGLKTQEVSMWDVLYPQRIITRLHYFSRSAHSLVCRPTPVHCHIVSLVPRQQWDAVSSCLQTAEKPIIQYLPCPTRWTDHVSD